MKVTIQYDQTPSLSSRSFEVARAFGLDLDEHRSQVVWGDIDVEIRSSDIVLITGPSGSGKSSFLRAVNDHYDVATLLAVDDDEVLIDGLGLPTDEAISVLAGVGLGEARLMTRRFAELSDGQKYRYRMAKLLLSEAEVLVVDEFASLLDTTTAQVMSYAFQREVRRRGKTLVCATCREDLDAFLLPSLRIHKRFGGEADIRRLDVVDEGFPLIDEIEYKSVSRAEYNKCPLLQFHYRQHSINSAICILFGYLRGEVVSVLVSAYPNLRSAGRNRFTQNRYVARKGEGSEALALLNREVATIKRVVVDPRFRGVGLGVHIVQEYLNRWATRSLVESEAVMARYNPFLEKAGMTPIYIQRTDDVEQRLLDLGFDVRRMRSRQYNEETLRGVDVEEVRSAVRKRISYLRSMGQYRDGRAEQLFEDDLPTFLTLVVREDTVWYGWNNPNALDDPPKTERSPRQ